MLSIKIVLEMARNKSKKQDASREKAKPSAKDRMLYPLAFDNTLQPNIISTVASGKIILVNKAACMLLGYSKKELLSKTKSAIFNMDERAFKKMLKSRTAAGKLASIIMAIKKDRSVISCQITSAIFGDAYGIQRAITTISDMSQTVLEQMNIDIEKAKIVAADIVLVKSKQKNIDARKEKIVAKDIIQAQEKSDSRLAENNKRVEAENKIKEKQFAYAMEEAKDMERSDIGKELHDNVNQLLGVSRLYIDMAKRGGKETETYLSRSSEYTLTAIEEIRRLTKKLTTGIIKNVGLSEAIGKLSRDTMDVSPIKISCALESLTESSVNDKFSHNVFRIVQEQLNNILRHARASEVAISLSQNKKSIILSVADNGAGFDTGEQHKGIGIGNIKSRAASCNGIANFVSRPGGGCTLTVTFPVTDVLLR
jgi:PAS domain S-box-containing protein